MNSLKKTLFAIIQLTLFLTQYAVDIPNKIKKTVGYIKGKTVEKATELGISPAKDKPYEAFIAVSNALNQYLFKSIKESLPPETREYIAHIAKEISKSRLNEEDLHALLLTKVNCDGETYFLPNATVYGLSLMVPFFGGPIRTLMLYAVLSKIISKK